MTMMMTRIYYGNFFFFFLYTLNLSLMLLGILKIGLIVFSNMDYLFIFSETKKSN